MNTPTLTDKALSEHCPECGRMPDVLLQGATTYTRAISLDDGKYHTDEVIDEIASQHVVAECLDCSKRWTIPDVSLLDELIVNQKTVDTLCTEDGRELKFVPLKKYGCFVTVDDGVLLESAILRNGNIDSDCNEVTAPQSQEFLDVVNAIFGTKYKYSEFAGR